MGTTLGKSPSRSEVLRFLFHASNYGNLGLFIGAGFSKAIFSAEEDNVALSWSELLKAASEKMDVDLSKLKREGVSFPELASLLCNEHAATEGVSFQESLKILKNIICDATAWYPTEPSRSEYAQYISDLDPSWIVTTNYDQILECLMPGLSVSLGPDDSFSSRKGSIPIFHLHGIRTDPDRLIIAQEDYVSLFRPNEYRQIRLALTMKESTTCLLGYGLGDVNVLTALDWSKNVYRERKADYPHEVIQVLRKTKKPETDPYRSGSGILILETSEIADFCQEYSEAIVSLREKQLKQEQELRDVAAMLKASAPDDVTNFIDDGEWRQSILKGLKSFSLDLVAGFESFIEKCFAEVKRRSQINGAFHEYANNLHITLDLLTAFEWEDFPPALMPVVVNNFGRLAFYIGRRRGDSHAAAATWDERKGELSEGTVTELRALARQYGHSQLSALLKPLPPGL
jgi:hypothetical protein